MADRPILFSAPMVRALLEGRKTQTRHVLPDQSLWRDDGTVWTGFMGWQPVDWALSNRGAVGKGVLPHYAPGDRLWVREAWRTNVMWDRLNGSQLSAVNEFSGRVSVLFEAGGALLGSVDASDAGRYRHARFMPRWASRLTLLVTDVRVQRLQDISQADALAEGVQYSEAVDLYHVAPFESDTAAGAFESLWNSINGPDAWAANPWVAATTFDVVRANIDQVQP